ncbi:hypothetical protein PYCC9005_000330 [Savitreella phatthalungensis]
MSTSTNNANAAGTNSASQPRRLSFGPLAGDNDGMGGGFYKNLQKQRRGSQPQADAAKDMLRRDSISDAWNRLFR